jgi:hypothetical protein
MRRVALIALGKCVVTRIRHERVSTRAPNQWDKLQDEAMMRRTSTATVLFSCLILVACSDSNEASILE